MKANEVLETYPVQFRDKIDEYLWKEHHIIGGCCSSIGEMKYSVAREVAEKLTDAFIEKAQLFLIDKLKEIPMGSGKMKIKAECSLDKFIEDFKNYMEGE